MQVSGGAPTREIGEVFYLAHNAAPGSASGECVKPEGQNISRTTYATCFGKLGVLWGAGDGATTFTLPDARRRSLVGAGGAGTAALGNAVGNVGGEEAHALTSSENGPHTHSGPITTNGGGGQPLQIVGGDGAISVTVNSSGSGTAHNTYHPAAVAQAWIRIR